MINSINYLFPSYGFIIGGIIVSIVVFIIGLAITYTVDADRPFAIPIVLFIVLIIVSIILNAIYNKNRVRNNTLEVTRAISVNEETCGEMLSNINAYINERDNILINLADIIKSYDDFESKILVEIVKAKSDVSYNAVLSRINERYPNVRSIENYSKLIAELDSKESQLRDARKEYNRAVKCYNSIITNSVYMACIPVTNAYTPKQYLEDSINGDFRISRIMGDRK